jgi:hypothetical protein
VRYVVPPTPQVLREMWTSLRARRGVLDRNYGRARELSKEIEAGKGIAGGFAAGLATWVVPGLGYLFAGRLLRGLLVAGVVFLMYIVGLMLGGHLFGLRNAPEVGLLAYIYGFCDLGSGLIYALCEWLGIGLIDQAQRATAEYGNIFLIVAGLLNYLAALDTFDVVVGRKR